MTPRRAQTTGALAGLLSAAACIPAPNLETPMSTSALDAIERICTHLSLAPVTGEALAATLGALERKSRSAFYVAPSNHHFSRIVVSQPGSEDVVRSVTLQLAEPLALQTLNAAWGEPTTPPQAPSGPQRRTWSPAPPDRHKLSCTRIATLTLAGEVDEIILRPDPIIP